MFEKEKKSSKIFGCKKKILTFAIPNGKSSYTFAEVAQLVEHNLAKVRVASSSLVFRSKNAKTFAEVAQLVEHNLAKVRVASSSLVFRSKSLR